MITWPNFFAQLFNGLASGALLALIASGLTIIYGTLGVLNLAHGAMFMIGGYAGFVAFQYTGSFTVAVIAGSLFVMLLGVVMERVIIRHFYHRPHEDQLLVTFGLAICLVEAVRFSFGSLSKTSFDMRSGSSMNQYVFPRPLVRNFETSSRRNEMRLVDDVNAASIAPVCIAA